MPDYYFEAPTTADGALETALEVFERLAARIRVFVRAVVRPRSRPTGSMHAERAIVALGSSAGTIKDVVDDLRDEGDRVGLLKVVSFRPFPAQAIAALLRNSSAVIVLDRAASPGGAAPLLATSASTTEPVEGKEATYCCHLQQRHSPRPSFPQVKADFADWTQRVGWAKARNAVTVRRSRSLVCAPCPRVCQTACVVHRRVGTAPGK